ncbi:MAG: nucleotidyltransferase [Acidobacteria bacterium]|nr:nucleotidyltransferase [Acidobacteriota bacterium]
MTYVDEAFAKLRSQLEITKTESDLAARRHRAIRDHVSSHWDLEDDFLTGSYRRHTKTKKLKDVDIFVVVRRSGEQGHLRDLGPRALLEELKMLLDEKYDSVTIDRMACTIDFGSEEILSFDVVPAFKRKTGGYEIPDTSSGWIATNPKRHHEMTTEKNAACDQKFVPFVKMVKGANRELGEPVDPSFLLEVMALELVTSPFGRYQDEIVWFLATAADEFDRAWPDPAGIGPDVNTMSERDRRTASTAFQEAQQIAERAVWMEDNGQEKAAVEEWRRLFDWRMPRP